MKLFVASPVSPFFPPAAPPKTDYQNLNEMVDRLSVRNANRRFLFQQNAQGLVLNAETIKSHPQNSAARKTSLLFAREFRSAQAKSETNFVSAHLYEPVREYRKTI